MTSLPVFLIISTRFSPFVKISMNCKYSAEVYSAEISGMFMITSYASADRSSTLILISNLTSD